MIGKRGLTGEPINLASSKWQQRLVQETKRRREAGDGPDVIFIDNVSTAFRGIDENSNSEVAAINYFLEELRELGLLVVFLHHTGKLSDGEQVTNKKMRGASAWSAGVDTSIALQRLSAKDDELGAVRARWTFDDERGEPCHPRSFEVRLEEWGHEHTPPGEKPFLRLVEHKTIPDIILSYLRACHKLKPASPQDLQEELQKCRRTCYDRATTAERLGLVEPGSRTVLTEAGRAAIGV